MKQHPLLFVLFPVAISGAILFASACTTNTVHVTGGGDAAVAATCDPSVCATGNMCIPDEMGASACRLPCAKHSDCPFNTECHVSGAQNYCIKLTTAVMQKRTGQWGEHCLPGDGQTNNPACDSADGFACYATGTTDALAYCTLYGCQADTDCAGGFFCGTVNTAPNAKSDDRTFGKTHSVCLKHDYCSPCYGDLDCPVVDGKQMKCTPGADGTVASQYCAPPCSPTAATCRLDATCSGVSLDGTKVCRPLAHTCKGDGSLCSPCRSDADCPTGICVKGNYSPETFCTVKSKITCTASPDMGTTPGMKSCPTITVKPAPDKTTEISCSTSSDSTLTASQCIGVVPFGDNYDLGCYTRHP